MWGGRRRGGGGGKRGGGGCRRERRGRRGRRGRRRRRRGRRGRRGRRERRGRKRRRGGGGGGGGGEGEGRREEARLLSDSLFLLSTATTKLDPAVVTCLHWDSNPGAQTDITTHLFKVPTGSGKDLKKLCSS